MISNLLSYPKRMGRFHIFKGPVSTNPVCPSPCQRGVLRDWKRETDREHGRCCIDNIRVERGILAWWLSVENLTWTPLKCRCLHGVPAVNVSATGCSSASFSFSSIHKIHRFHGCQVSTDPETVSWCFISGSWVIRMHQTKSEILR